MGRYKKFNDFFEAYQTFGASDSDEKMAGKASMNYAAFKHSGRYRNSDAFKTDLKRGYLKPELMNRLADGKVTIKGGSKADLQFKTTGKFNEKEVRAVFDQINDRYEKVEGTKLFVVDFSDKEFWLTLQPGKYESVTEGNNAFKGDFAIGGIQFKSAVVTQHGSDHGVYVFLKKPDYRKAKIAAEELAKIEAKFFKTKFVSAGGYDQSGDQVNTVRSHSKEDATKFAKHLLTLNESVNEGNMPSKFIGNDNIVYIKTKEDSKGANYNLYYKGHDIDSGGRRFSSEKELKDFAANYILSNQLYNKLKWEKEKPLPKAVDESLDEALKVDHKEPGKKKVNIMVGRFQPPTLGHLKVLKAISKENGHPVIVLTVRAKKVDKTKTPFETETIEMMFNDLAKKYDFVEGIRVIDAAAIDKIFNELRPEYEPILWGTGTDRLKGYSRQAEKEEYRKDLGVDDAFGMYEIKRDEDNISASKVRAAIKADDEKLFQSMVDKALHGYFPELKTQLEDK